MKNNKCGLNLNKAIWFCFQSGFNLNKTLSLLMRQHKVGSWRKALRKIELPTCMICV